MTTIEELKQLKQLLDEGILTEEEFQSEKSKLMSSLRTDLTTTDNENEHGSRSTMIQAKEVSSNNVTDKQTKASEFTTVAEESQKPESKTTQKIDDKGQNKTIEAQDKIRAATNTAKDFTQKATNKAAEMANKIPMDSIKQATSKNGNKLPLIIGIVVLIVIGGFFIHWSSNSDYRAAMKSADSYFADGKYGDAEEQYKKAHDLNGDDKSLEYYDYAKELGQAWRKINDGDYKYDSIYTNTSERSLYDNLVSETSSIQDEDVQKAYKETTDRMANNAGY